MNIEAIKRDDIIRLANEAGIKGPAPARQGFKMYANPQRLITFAALVAAAEREACAKVQEFVCSTGLCRFTLTQTGVGIGERGMQAYEEAKKRGWVGISEEQPSDQGVSNDQKT